MCDASPTQGRIKYKANLGATHWGARGNLQRLRCLSTNEKPTTENFFRTIQFPQPISNKKLLSRFALQRHIGQIKQRDTWLGSLIPAPQIIKR